MAKPLRKAQARLAARREDYDALPANKKQAYRPPGSMNRHKGTNGIKAKHQ